jgi:hypothetical protein
MPLRLACFRAACGAAAERGLKPMKYSINEPINVPIHELIFQIYSNHNKCHSKLICKSEWIGLACE